MEPISTIADDRADDIAATPSVLAWTHAWLDVEAVWVAHRDGDAWSAPVPAFGGLPATRPSLARDGDAVWLAAATERAGRLAASVVRIEGTSEAAAHCVAPDRPADVFEVAVAVDERATWLAFDALSRDARTVHLASVGTTEPVAAWSDPRRPARSPRLCAATDGLWMAWLEAVAPGRRAHLRVARLDADDPAGEPALTVALGGGDDAQHEAPAIAALPDGGVLVAWHARWALADGAHSVVRWLHLARIASNGAVQRVPLPPPPVLDRSSAGEDQGWEFPALLVAGDRWWLAGRSSQGWHATSGTLGEAGSARIRLDEAGWGGRGRVGAFAGCVGDGGHFYGRDRTQIAAWALPRGAAPDPTARVLDTTTPPDAPAPGLPIHGDIHQHTILSDGTGSLDDALQAAVDRGWGFTAITDHDRFCRRAIGPLTWRRTVRLADRYTATGAIVVLRGYEFTGARPPGPGHKNVYFTGDGADGEPMPEALPEHTTEALAALLRAHPALVVPHHLGFTGADADHHDPEVQPVWELCSVHGIYEDGERTTAFPARTDFLLPDQWARVMLDRGLRFGFVGGSDNHGLVHHHGICPKRDPASAGLTVVHGVAEPTRAAILDAIASRRCHATTGAPIDVAVSVGGHVQGSAVAERPVRTRVELAVRAGAPIASVEVVLPGGIDLPVPAPETAAFAASVDVELPAEGPAWVYVRVTRSDGEMAWSSPVFFGAA